MSPAMGCRSYATPTQDHAGFQKKYGIIPNALMHSSTLVLVITWNVMSALVQMHLCDLSHVDPKDVPIF